MAQTPYEKMGEAMAARYKKATSPKRSVKKTSAKKATKKPASKAKLGSGKRFSSLQNTVAEEYEKKGMSADKAEKVGAAVAYKQGVKAHGKGAMKRMATKGKSKGK